MAQNNVNAAPEYAEEALFASLGVAPGSVIDGKFRIERSIGTGGMSCVLEATHLMLDETVALKCLSPTWAGSELVASRFSGEARAVAKIKSDHVAKVYDVGKLPNGLPYIVMELLVGEDLGRLLERREGSDVRTLAGWMIEACAGLAEAHALGIVHRDVKPENLFVIRRSDGRRAIKLLDFGISKQLLRGSELDQMSLSRTLELVGTPLYMSPEQVRLSRTLDHRTDIWSLGAVFYEVLTGTPPFTGEGVTDLCARILEDPARAPSESARGIPAEIDRIALRCLEKDPQRRYPSVAELATELLPFASPRYHPQVDRIIRTLHAAGLTSLELSSVPPPALGELGSMLSLPAQSAVPRLSLASEPLFERSPSQSGVLSLSEAETLPAPGSNRGRVIAATAIAALVLLALAAVGLVIAKPSEPRESASASAPSEPEPQAPAARPAPPAAERSPAPEREPEREPAIDTSAAAAPSALPRPAAPIAPRPRAAPKPKPTPPAPAPTPAPKPGLDIELSR